MLQELFRIPFLGLPVYGYGLMLVIGVWSAVELGRYLANRNGLRGDDFVTIGLLALGAGVFGARLSHVIENLGKYTDTSRSAWENLKDAANLSSGGLTFYGGFIFATIVLIAWAKWRKIPLRLGMDVVAPCLMVGLAFGRVGCLLNGCCWGQTCDPNQVPWAITFPYGSPPYEGQFEDGDIELGDGPGEVPPALTQPMIEKKTGRRFLGLVPKEDVANDPQLTALARNSRSLAVHPTQVYSTINAFLIAGICIAFLRVRPKVGRVFALMLLLYGPARFTLETLRIEPAVLWGWSFSMWTSVGTFAMGVVLWFVFGAMKQPGESPAFVDGEAT